MQLFQCQFNGEWCYEHQFDRVLTNMGACLSFNNGKLDYSFNACCSWAIFTARRYPALYTLYATTQSLLSVCESQARVLVETEDTIKQAA